jgi:hypothetical protein
MIGVTRKLLMLLSYGSLTSDSGRSLRAKSGPSPSEQARHKRRPGSTVSRWPNPGGRRVRERGRLNLWRDSHAQPGPGRRGAFGPSLSRLPMRRGPPLLPRLPSDRPLSPCGAGRLARRRGAVGRLPGGDLVDLPAEPRRNTGPSVSGTTNAYLLCLARASQTARGYRDNDD